MSFHSTVPSEHIVGKDSGYEPPPHAATTRSNIPPCQTSHLPCQTSHLPCQTRQIAVLGVTLHGECFRERFNQRGRRGRRARRFSSQVRAWGCSATGSDTFCSARKGFFPTSRRDRGHSERVSSCYRVCPLFHLPLRKGTTSAPTVP